MELLFDFEDNAVNEMRQHVPGLAVVEDFEFLRSFVETATDELIDLVGQEVYEVLVKRYLDDDDLDPALAKKVDQLVRYAQSIIAKSAYLQFAPILDLKNDGNGRRMHVDEHSKAPWEWMITAADEAVFSQWQKGVNRLMNELDRIKLEAWIHSDAYKARQSLLCAKPADVDPVSKSYWFFSKTLHFNQDAQEDVLPAALGMDAYQDLLLKLKASDQQLSAEQKQMVSRAKKLIRHLVMVRAFQELPLEFLPQGLVQRFRSDRDGKKASTPATEQLLDRALSYHRSQAELEATRLRELVRLQQLQNQEPEQTKSPDTNEKFYRV